MVMTLVTDWENHADEPWGDRTQVFRHNLHERPMFSDEGLIHVLDRYPREKLGVFTMGQDPVDWRTWRRGVAGELTGQELLDAAKQGRIWLNLREVNSFIECYGALGREIFGDLEAHTPGLKTFRHDIGLLISSPGAQVFYHLDATPVTLWQIRGEKRMWVYPRRAPFVTDEQIEGVVLREKAEQFAYDPSWDDQAEVIDMLPGVMASWPQNAPHRLVNGPMLNVSLSIEYLTPPAMLRANVLYTNGLMRRRLGLEPRLKEGFTPVNLAKFGLARAAKALKLQKEISTKSPPSFRLEPERPGIPAAL